MLTKQDKIFNALDELKSATTDILGLAVVSPDGMLIADRLAAGEGEKAAAMGAVMVSLGKRVSTTLKAGELQEVAIRGDKMTILVFDIEHHASLVVEVSSRANMGLVLLEARATKDTLLNLLTK